MDNFDALEITSEAELRHGIHRTSRFATDVGEVCEKYGVEHSVGKTVERELGGKLLGSQLFASRRVRCPGDASLPLIQLTV